MRVCMLAYSFYSSDTRILQYARALADRGDEVDVIGLRHKGFPNEEVMDGVRLYRLQARERDERGPLSYLFRILRFLFRSAYVLAKNHFDRPYDLIHVHSVPDFLVFAALLPMLTGARVILDIHDILPEFYASKFDISNRSLMFRLLRLVEKVSITAADHVIIANHLWWERLVSRSVPREKCTPICNYPDPRFFHLRPRTRANGKFVMMYPGTLNWHQGLDVAVKAFAKIADQAPMAEFHIYGGGPTLQNLKDLAGKLNLDGRVVFLDSRPLGEIAEIMSQADLAVVPKRSESFGNEAVSTKTLEFMALGVPVIQSRTKVDTYYHTESRVTFFQSENVDDLAKCMLTLMRDQELRKRLVANAQEYVKENNWDVRKHEYLELVDSLVSRPGRKADEKLAMGAAKQQTSSQG